MTIIIHLEKEQTDYAIQKLRFAAETLFDYSDHLYTHCAQVQWEGSSKDDFLFDLYRCTTNLKTLSDSLDLLSFRLAQKTTGLFEAASTFNQS